MNMLARTFRWGVHPPENKAQSTAAPIQAAPLPARLVLPVQQHIGAPAEAMVEVGQRVRKGEVIAAANGFLSAPVHAPSSGTVTAVCEHQVPHPSGLAETCVVIETDGRDEWVERQPLADHKDQPPAKLLEHIRACGIAGLGGAGFPTAVKLGSGAQSAIETLILNGVECEPYITADDRLMAERAGRVLEGAALLARLVKPRRTLVVVEDNKSDAIAALRSAGGDGLAEIVVIPTKYPSGGEKQTIQIVTGREVPHGGIPADIGVVCVNVGTAVAVRDAVVDGTPLISRIVTLTGDALGRRGNFEVLLGTPIGELLTHCGLDDERLDRLIMGGPMMGFTLPSRDLPVVKTTNCILASAKGELKPPGPEQPCIRCGLCAEACPAMLLPQQLYWYARASEFERAEKHHLFDCIECGACAYVCPSNIPLVQYYRYAKGEIRHAEQERIKAERSRERFEFRKERLEREEAEKEARRRERREAAKKKAEQKAQQADAGGGSGLSPEIAAAVERVRQKKAARRQETGPADDASDSRGSES